MAQPPIIIAGAGITGLLLAQALKKQSIPFVVLERDPDPLYRGKGWGITIHWALNTLLELLPQSLIDRLPEAYVDGDATKNGENGNFLFFNLKTGEALWQVPPAKRIRMGREKFRRILMDDIPIKWGYTFKSFSASETGPVKATFTTVDGHEHIVEGSMIVGCDGSRSQVRRSLFPDPAIHSNYQLPIRLLGASTIYSGAFTSKVRALDPFFFQGGHPDTDAAHWFSFLDSPNSSGRGDDSRECQILVSWPYRANFMGNDKPLELPAESRDRVALMKTISSNWADPFYSIVQAIPEDNEVKSISLEDWVPPREHWNDTPGSGRVILVGDSAHAMTMYRGEAANHGITDVHVLLSEILPVMASDRKDYEEDLKQACDIYTERMVERTAPAVLNSRQACLDAHVYKNINDDSPLIFKRAAYHPEEARKTQIAAA